MPKPKGVHLWVILVVLLAITAAGGAYALTRGDDGLPRDSLRVEVLVDEGAEPVAKLLDCENIDTARVCGALTPRILEPVPNDQACTMIYGGPQTATITGTLNGNDVDAAFSRVNGCEIARWDALAKILKPIGIKGLT